MRCSKCGEIFNSMKGKKHILQNGECYFCQMKFTPEQRLKFRGIKK